MRTSRVAYVVVRLLVGGRDYFLLQKHRKWGDWSLIGGHVEPYEGRDWLAAGRREADEELTPLRFGFDFSLERLASAPSHWGPMESRSAGGALTSYDAAWFALIFLWDPAACLAQLPAAEFILISRGVALSGRDRSVTGLLRRLDAALPSGLDGVPLAWGSSLAADAIRLETRDDANRVGDRLVGAR